jgi:hypothetical protein
MPPMKITKRFHQAGCGINASLLVTLNYSNKKVFQEINYNNA